MMRLIATILATCALAATAHAQPKRMERSVEKQREAVEAWTACIADENREEVAAMLVEDYRSDSYAKQIEALAEKRVSSECFAAMPRSYRKIQLGGLPFAGGLAERMIETGSETPLLNRLGMAAIGKQTEKFSYTDQVANCAVRGAPHLVAALFDSEINSEAETAAFAQLAPVFKVCTSQGAPIEASPLALRSMLATAAFRVLEAQKDETDA